MTKDLKDSTLIGSLYKKMKEASVDDIGKY